VTVWRIYRGRADCDQPEGCRTARGWSREAGCGYAALNRIKKLKYDFAADSFNMKDFWATEAALNTVILAYNLMSLMRQVLLKSSVVKHSFILCSTHCRPAIQAICEAGLHHYRKPQTHPESSHGDATANVDAGLVGCCQSLRFAS
jgi:hypothetical protein